jgi:hypothetical protein
MLIYLELIPRCNSKLLNLYREQTRDQNKRDKGNQYSIQYVNKTSDKNKNVDIQFSEHDAFLERHSSGTIEIERSINIIK